MYERAYFSKPKSKKINNIQCMAKGGKRVGAGRPKGKMPAERIVELRKMRMLNEITREEFGKAARSFAAYALKGLAFEALNGSLDHAREILDRGYGRIPEVAGCPLDITPPATNGHEPPIRLEDFRRVDR